MCMACNECHAKVSQSVSSENNGVGTCNLMKGLNGRLKGAVFNFQSGKLSFLAEGISMDSERRGVA